MRDDFCNGLKNARDSLGGRAKNITKSGWSVNFSWE